MDAMPPGIIVSEDAALRAALAELARDARLVFFAGLPGTGKSLLIHQLAHLAHGEGRRIHLLQWDVVRPRFEASRRGQRYPQARGVTHGVIRLAVGRWARAALGRWHATHAGGEDILIGETPLAGHRLIELARPGRDRAEPVLAAGWTRFVIPVPSRALRAHLEAERERRVRRPLHPREREDAPPEVLRDLWRQLVQVARIFGVDSLPAPGEAAPPYDPAVYQGVYERLLAHRDARVLPLATRLPVGDLSAYDLRVPILDVVPTAADARRFIRQVEARYPDPEALRREIDGWYRIA